MDLNVISNNQKFKANVLKKFEKISKENNYLYKLIYETSNLTNVYLIGGFLRSIANNIEPRDIDVMVNLPMEYLEEKLKNNGVNFSKNKLGGIKICLNSINVDVWTVNMNWAFRNNIIVKNEKNVLQNIADGTFFNYDSLVFDLNKNHSSFKNYNECVLNKTLRILSNRPKYKFQNPGRIGNAVRAMQIRQKWDVEFSFELCMYIKKEFERISIFSIKDQVEFILQFVNNESNKRFLSLNNEVFIKQQCLYIGNTIEKKLGSSNLQLDLF